MLSRKHRLSFNEDFDRVKKEGSLYQGKLFAISVLKRGDTNPSRFGFVVSTRVSKKAVERNKAKRRLREVVRKSLGEIKTGYDVLFLATKNTLVASPKSLEKEGRTLFKNSGIIKRKE